MSCSSADHLGDRAPAVRPDLPIGLACLRPPRDPAQAIARLGITAVHANAAYTGRDDIGRLRAAGLAVAVATVNDSGEVARFLELGAHGVMTDRPALLGEAPTFGGFAPTSGGFTPRHPLTRGSPPGPRQLGGVNRRGQGGGFAGVSGQRP